MWNEMQNSQLRQQLSSSSGCPFSESRGNAFIQQGIRYNQVRNNPMRQPRLPNTGMLTSTRSPVPPRRGGANCAFLNRKENIPKPEPSCPLTDRSEGRVELQKTYMRPMERADSESQFTGGGRRRGKFDEPDDEQLFCKLGDQNKDGYVSRLLKRFQSPPATCDKRTPSTAESVDPNDYLTAFDELWKLRTFTRWQKLPQWDQHKETFWRQLISMKIDSPHSLNERGLVSAIKEALNAVMSSDNQCIGYKMLYELLKRNEDLDLLPYIIHFSDKQIVRIATALNRLFFEDKDKSRITFDNPPASNIEKTMMKETLKLIEPDPKIPFIAKKCWHLLLDWYAERSKSCPKQQ